MQITLKRFEFPLKYNCAQEVYKNLIFMVITMLNRDLVGAAILLLICAKMS